MLSNIIVLITYLLETRIPEAYVIFNQSGENIQVIVLWFQSTFKTARSLQFYHRTYALWCNTFSKYLGTYFSEVDVRFYDQTEV